MSHVEIFFDKPFKKYFVQRSLSVMKTNIVQARMVLEATQTTRTHWSYTGFALNALTTIDKATWVNMFPRLNSYVGNLVFWSCILSNRSLKLSSIRNETKNYTCYHRIFTTRWLSLLQRKLRTTIMDYYHYKVLPGNFCSIIPSTSHVAPTRFELGISCIHDRCFNQLSHGATWFWTRVNLHK